METGLLMLLRERCEQNVGVKPVENVVGFPRLVQKRNVLFNSQSSRGRGRVHFHQTDTCASGRIHKINHII